LLVDRKNKPRIRSAREYRICPIGSQRLARLGRGTGIIYLLTGGLFSVGYLYDYWTLKEQLREIEAKN
jgi:hypothetical protein